MAKKTIAELRDEQVHVLADRDKDHDLEKAYKLMNSFYRFVGLRVRNVEDDNNEATYSTRWHAENEVREEIWGKRLDKAFAEYGLILEYYGIYPTITDHKGGDDVISTYYYD